MDVRARVFAAAIGKAALIAILAFAYLFLTRESLVYDTTRLWVEAWLMAGLCLALGRFRRRPGYTAKVRITSKVRIGRSLMALALAALIAISAIVSLTLTGTAPDSDPTTLWILAVSFLVAFAALLLILPKE